VKYALVTGGSRGIGRAICVKLAELGYHILINYRSNTADAEETLGSIEGNNGSGEPLRFDVTNPEEVENVLGKWKDNHEGEYIEVLVNNAGYSKDQLMVWMEKEEWSGVIDTNLNAFFYVTKMLLQDMIVNKNGRIINIASLSGIKGLPGQTNYAAAKAGLIGATKALAQELGKKKVTVNAVAPGFILTDMTEQLDVKELKKLIPLNRFGKPEEVADLVQFLASEKAAYITGEVISINGGLYT
jgi:3-oxoacyl-[acyl-carrier protein] reductase